MIQAGDGNWYAYIAEKMIADAATLTLFGEVQLNLLADFTFGTETDADAIYADADIVVRQSKTNAEHNATQIGL